MNEFKMQILRGRKWEHTSFGGKGKKMYSYGEEIVFLRHGRLLVYVDDQLKRFLVHASYFFSFSFFLEFGWPKTKTVSPKKRMIIDLLIE